MRPAPSGRAEETTVNHAKVPRGDETAAAPMLWRWSYVDGSRIMATDGEIGSVTDLSLDDESWTVRYLVVDTGTWLPGRQVLISPISVERVDLVERSLVARLTRAQIETSPGVDAAKTVVAVEREIEFARFWSFPYYWEGPYRWGPTPLPAPLGAAPTGAVDRRGDPKASREDPHLRSMREIRGYRMGARDGELGHVEDFLVEDGAWAIRYLIVDPRNWWPGNHVLIATEWITGVEWREGRVDVDLPRDAVRNAPEFDPHESLARDYEQRLHGHYGRAGYWDREVEAWRLWPAA
jgi:sporulation protein YlmC with PRC-barrel domain